VRETVCRLCLGSHAACRRSGASERRADLHDAVALERVPPALALQRERRHQPLDFWRLGVRLAVALLHLQAGKKNCRLVRATSQGKRIQWFSGLRHGTAISGLFGMAVRKQAVCEQAVCKEVEEAAAHLAVGVDVLPHVVVLGQVEQLADLGRALGAPQPRLLLVRQPRQLLLACRFSGRSK
jgi:hypothetical protein